eukprot:2364081-Pleurochrysis_carterae.AAC.1
MTTAHRRHLPNSASLPKTRTSGVACSSPIRTRLRHLVPSTIRVVPIAFGRAPFPTMMTARSTTIAMRTPWTEATRPTPNIASAVLGARRRSREAAPASLRTCVVSLVIVSQSRSTTQRAAATKLKSMTFAAARG